MALASCASAPPAARPGASASAPVLAPPAASVAAQADAAVAPAPAASTPAATTTGTRSGRQIYLDFQQGLASPQCSDTRGSRFRKQFAHAPLQMAKEDDGDLLAMFGYVVDALRGANLPTEFALIPFVESGYNPAARSHDGAAGMWQFVVPTARNQGLAINARYDGRLSPLESTRAAVDYFGHLYDEFDDNWELTLMAYNAGEFRIKGAMRRAGVGNATANPLALPGLSQVSYGYVRKLHALSCLFVEAGERDGWLTALDRQVPILQAVQLPDDARSLNTWSLQQGHDPALVRHLNPDQAGVLGGKRRVLAPVVAVWSKHGLGSADVALQASGDDANADTATDAATASRATKSLAAAARAHPSPRTHVVKRGDTLSSIARKYDVGMDRLRKLNKLPAAGTLKPGAVLRLR